MTPSFCCLTDTKQSLQYTINKHVSDPPMPEFEANVNKVGKKPVNMSIDRAGGFNRL